MFVVFEGIDGSGKTTISNRVAERLRAEGLAVTHLRAEGKFVSPVAEAIRELGRDSRNLELEPEAEFFLYVARDVQLIQHSLRPALARGDIVIADRFLFTAEVLGRYGRHLPKEFVDPVLRAAAGGLEPDLVVLVDVDPTLARARRKAFKLEVLDTRPPSRKGLAGVGLQHRIRNGYRELAREDPGRWAVVDNEDALEATLSRVTALLLDTHARGAAAALASFRAGAPIARAPLAQTVSTPAQALPAFLAWLDARLDREPRVAAYLLSGLFGPGIDERRRLLAPRVPRAVLAALQGLPDPVSWELREQLLGEYPSDVASTVSGLVADDPRARALRSRLLPVATAEVVASLARLDDDWSWEIRERYVKEYPELVVQGLGGLNSERSWAFRHAWLDATRANRGTHYELARVALRSVSGLEEERAWAVREECQGVAPVAAITSLNQLSSPRSFAWRERHLLRAPKAVMGTLRRLDLAEAWDLRRRVASDCKEALDSIQDLDSPAAWELRETHQDRWPSTVVKTLGILSDQERSLAFIERQLRKHPDNVSLLKHAAAVALGTHRARTAAED